MDEKSTDLGEIVDTLVGLSQFQESQANDFAALTDRLANEIPGADTSTPMEALTAALHALAMTKAVLDEQLNATKERNDKSVSAPRPRPAVS